MLFGDAKDQVEMVARAVGDLTPELVTAKL
jgi:hypothetical protein